MVVEIWHGLPYNRWEVLGKAGGLHLPPNPFQNFRIRKGDFFFQLVTRNSGEVEITIKLSNTITFSL